MRRLIVAAALLLCLATPAFAQDRRGEVVTDTPTYQGVTANAPIPGELHIKNEGGRDGAGLCVISSILCNGLYQGVPGLEGGKASDLWKAAKAADGGYYPQKLEELLKRVLPDEKWVSWEGDGTDLVDEYSRQGYPVGGTMNTGALYQYQPIHHMISVVHMDEKWACVVDNNDPGKFHWMPRREYDRRFVDGAKGWGFVWLRKPPIGAAGLFAVAVVILNLASATIAVLFGSRR